MCVSFSVFCVCVCVCVCARARVRVSVRALVHTSANTRTHKRACVWYDYKSILANKLFYNQRTRAIKSDKLWDKKTEK